MGQTETYMDPELIPSLFELADGENIFDSESGCVLAPHMESKGLGAVAAPSSRVERIPTVAPMPFLRSGPAKAFVALKQACIDGSGVDFLAVCGDVMRAADFSSNKPGVAQKSFHKTGSAFDYDQASKYLVIVSDPHNGRQYFRTYLKCVKQDGTMGTKNVLKDIRGYSTNVYTWDFTAAAEKLGWERIPAWAGWEHSYTKKEMWHYQIIEGKSYEYWIDFLYKNTPAPTNPPAPVFRVLKAGDTGQEVKDLQTKLTALGYLSGAIDGQFGPKTLAAVRALQKANGLPQDGIVGLRTLTVINNLQEKKKMGNEDFDFSTNDVNTQVAAEADVNATPKPWYATSQFLVLLATYVLGPLTIYLASKGVITPDQAPALVGVFQTAVVAGMGFLTHQFMKGRNTVSAIKAQAAAARSLAGTANAPEALAAFRSFGR